MRLCYSDHENRATNVPVKIESADGAKTVTVNERVEPPLPNGFISLGTFRFDAGKPGSVTISNEKVDGNVHADAVQILPAK